MVIKMMRMDAANADYQVKRIVDCVDLVDQARKTLSELREGQTAMLWTSDGKSVDLAEELRTRYRSSEQWLASIREKLADASANLQKAIDETDDLDASQKAYYQVKLVQALGPVSPGGPIAV